MRTPLLLRAVATALVTIAILIPISMIAGKVSEREGRARTVVEQFAAETSGPQVVAGPLLMLTCEETHVEDREVKRGGRAETVTETLVRDCPLAFMAPRVLDATATMQVESRRRGIYPIRLYRAEVTLSATFEWPAPPAAEGRDVRRWKEAYLVASVTDPRGVQSVATNLSGDLLAGRGDPAFDRFTVRQLVGPWSSRKAGDSAAVELRLGLQGTSSLSIAPVADRTQIAISSDWPHPSFGREWSPNARNVTARGFEASWRLTSVATGGPSKWTTAAIDGKLAREAGAGVSLFDPINVYALSYRATEYAFLFVLFTFGALALTEVLSGIRLHVVQYALVGSGVAVFFLLLLALSEHVRFGVAYAVAAGACVALLTFYLRHPLGTRARTALMGALFAALYGGLYVLLMSEDHALLMGSILVFAILAVAMVTTRKLDWNALAERMAARA